MFGWLFKSKPTVVNIEKETRFSQIPIGREFQKAGAWSENITYIKTGEYEYETIENGYHCIKWYRVHEDFMVKYNATVVA